MSGAVCVRLEDINGQGVYTVLDEIDKRDVIDTVACARHPMPCNDGLPDTRFMTTFRHGFRDAQQMDAWFSRAERVELARVAPSVRLCIVLTSGHTQHGSRQTIWEGGHRVLAHMPLGTAWEQVECERLRCMGELPPYRPASEPWGQLTSIGQAMQAEMIDSFTGAVTAVEMFARGGLFIRKDNQDLNCYDATEERAA